jgi:hypothetical protein
MKRYWRLLLCLALLLVIGASLLHPAVHWRLIGWARGEAFYLGRPTSYWKSECRQWEHRYDHPAGSWTGHFHWVRHSTWLEMRIGQWTGQLPAKTAEKMPLLQGDQAAVHVIVELAGQDDPHVLYVALFGMGSIMCEHRENIEPTIRSALIPTLQRVARRQDEEGSIAAVLLRHLEAKYEP